MKKFIAGVVLTVVAFMALTTGAFARSYTNSPNGQTNGGKACTSDEDDYDTNGYSHGNW